MGATVLVWHLADGLGIVLRGWLSERTGFPADRHRRGDSDDSSSSTESNGVALRDAVPLGDIAAGRRLENPPARLPPQQSSRGRIRWRFRTTRRLVLIVRLSSEPARQVVHQDCSFAKKQESPHALLVVVRSRRLVGVGGDDRFRPGAVPATRVRPPRTSSTVAPLDGAAERRRCREPLVAQRDPGVGSSRWILLRSSRRSASSASRRRRGSGAGRSALAPQ